MKGASDMVIGRSSVNFGDLPMWRKVVIVCALTAFCFLGTMATKEEITIYSSAPSSPSPATKRIYPIYVMHGSLRYVTSDESEQAYFWRKKMGGLIPVPFLIAVVVLVTARQSKAR